MARLGLLRAYDFRQLFVANTISQVGTQVSQLALPIVAVLVLHSTPFEMGLLVACRSLPYLLIGLPAGAWVDRMRRRRVLITGDLGRAVLLGTVPLTWALGHLVIVQLYLVALAVGCLSVFFDVAYQSYLPNLVSRDQLVEGNARLEAANTTSMVAGPAVAGLLIKAVSAPLAVLLDALSFLGSALFIGRIHKSEPAPERADDRHLGREILEGLRFVLSNRLLRAIAMSTAWINLFGSMVDSMTALLWLRVLGLSSGIYGLILSLGAVGAVLGSFAARRVTQRLGQGRTIWLIVALTRPFALLLVIVQPGGLLWLTVALWPITWAGAVIYNITQVSLRQGLTPDHMLGRMNASMRFMVWGTLPIGSLIGGLLGETLGVRETILIGTAGAVLGFIPALLSPLRNQRKAEPETTSVAEPANEQPGA